VTFKGCPDKGKARVKLLKQDRFIEPEGQDFDKVEVMAGERRQRQGEARRIRFALLRIKII
jgi:hypothetical protein